MLNTVKGTTQEHDCRDNLACVDCEDLCCLNPEHEEVVERSGVACGCGSVVCVNCQHDHKDECDMMGHTARVV